jgi:hypothetical protein
MPCSNPLGERQGDLTQKHAKLGHAGFVEHHAVAHQAHPVIELHLPHAAIYGQTQGVAPAKRVATGGAFGKPHHVIAARSVGGL